MTDKPSTSSDNSLSSADDIYANSAGEQLTGQFTFDSAVARVFPDMIKRSVPGYAETVAMSGVIAGEYARDNTNLYDLGCSLGAVTLAMRHGVKADNCTIFGIDNSAAMIEQAGHYLALDEGGVDVELACADITQLSIENASVVALNYVLQFIPQDQRLDLLSNIAQGLNVGGALILSEKICFSADEQKLQDDLHLDFKRANGYSELEIAQKRSAIENVLIPETDATHIARLKQAGFSQVIRWYQCFNFVSYLAIK
ncbi:carboxy-S-adenosyl-L-methionine synthase CmoA [Oleispira antarctica]|uniref:Carboxy-S-adenosyl-L-methionine synthase n=1 Tax=Oleispira antarctica TaxID=188908 RepID=A0A1Y5HA84_OLEAN|nr:carboxy-S-adenosyl-L-methionine synthase CmoA [Oleispira antarctica]